MSAKLLTCPSQFHRAEGVVFLIFSFASTSQNNSVLQIQAASATFEKPETDVWLFLLEKILND